MKLTKYILPLAVFSFGLSAGTLFDGDAGGTFYHAAGTGSYDNNFSFSNSSGDVTVTNGSGSNGETYAFGRLDSTFNVADVGDYIELGFTIAITSGWSNGNNITMSLIGKRAGTITDGNIAANGATRRYAGMN